MNIIKKATALATLALIALAAFGGSAGATHIEPIFVSGNPSCETLNADGLTFPTITSDFGFKLDGAPEGTFTLTNSPGELTGDAPSDPGNSVTISNVEDLGMGEIFDWAATLGIDAVIVKGGPNSDAYVYDPESFGDNDLHAPLNLDNNKYYAISHIEFCYDYELDVSKDAATSFTRTYNWTITKTPDATYDLFKGDTRDHKYTVSVDKTGFTDSNWAVAGSIYVTNNTPLDAVITGVTDALPDSSNLTVDCGVNFPHTLPKDQTLTCDYSADLPNADTRTNTATATLQNYDYDSAGAGTADGTTPFSGTASVDFATATITKVNDTVSVTDTNSDFGIDKTVSDDTSWMYESEFACDADQGPHINTAKVIGDNAVELASDTATVTINCYDLTVTKDAEGTYDERHIWDIAKSVSPNKQSGFPGDILSWEWKVTLSETSVDENFSLKGDITISNVGNPIPAVINSVTDVVNATGLIDVNASVDCDFNFPHTIPAQGTLACKYDAGTNDLRDYKLNTATATLQNYDYASDGTATAAGTTDFSGTASVNYTANVLNGSAVVNDDQEPAFDPDGLTVYAGDGPWTWTEIQSHTCSSNRDDYWPDGIHYAPMSETINNEATVHSGDELQDQATAFTRWICNASFVDIYKTTNDEIRDDLDIRFRLYDADDNDLNDEVSTLDDVDGKLQFATALVPGDTYQICESPVPAAYTFEVRDEAGNVVTTTDAGPPGTENPTGEVQCFSFVAADRSVTREFSINNSFPGGAPRTPGYWKNWSECSGGNQVITAEKLNGGLPPADPYSGGVYLLDDLLPQILGDEDVYSFAITTCAEGVSILSAQSLDGTNRANDAAYTLARALLAARLNQDAGACTAAEFTFDLSAYELGAALTFEQVLTAADDVLSQVSFNGTASYLSPLETKGKNNPLKALAQQALALYEIIDDYNNGEICTGTPSH